MRVFFLCVLSQRTPGRKMVAASERPLHTPQRVRVRVTAAEHFFWDALGERKTNLIHVYVCMLVLVTDELRNDICK